MNIEVLNYTHNPLTTIGENASICYNTKLKDSNHASRIAKRVINDGHGRNLEFADLTVEISGVSARVIRELYTHIQGTSRVQASTRYITYDNFTYHTPELTEKQEQVYHKCMKNIRESYKQLKDLGLENDKTGYILPLAMDTTMVLKINARALIHMANLRMCQRALKEYRELMKEFKRVVSELDDEWKWIADNHMIPQCMVFNKCPENNNNCIMNNFKSDI